MHSFSSILNDYALIVCMYLRIEFIINSFHLILLQRLYKSLIRSTHAKFNWNMLLCVKIGKKIFYHLGSRVPNGT